MTEQANELADKARQVFGGAPPLVAQAKAAVADGETATKTEPSPPMSSEEPKGVSAKEVQASRRALAAEWDEYFQKHGFIQVDAIKSPGTLSDESHYVAGVGVSAKISVSAGTGGLRLDGTQTSGVSGFCTRILTRGVETYVGYSGEPGREPTHWVKYCLGLSHVLRQGEVPR